MIKSQVIILGGGVSGIACARALQSAGIDYLLIEASGKLGGRLKSDRDAGYIFDHGFQVFLSCYSHTLNLINSELNFSAFAPGAISCFNGARYQIADPFRQPERFFSTLTAPIGSLWDKIIMLRLKLLSSLAARDADPDGWKILSCSLSALTKLVAASDGISLSGLSSEEYLRRLGFSERIVDTFFRPFLGGIFLDDSLSTSANLLLQVFGNFSRGEAQLPDGGMAEVAKAIADPLDSKRIMLNQRVVNFTADKVVLESGEILQTRAVVSALDVDSLRVVKPYLNLPRSNTVSCFYFSSETMPEVGNYLLLNSSKFCKPTTGSGDHYRVGNNKIKDIKKGGQDFLINNIAPLSNINRTYAPLGKVNLSVSVLGEYSDEQVIKREMEQIFPGRRFEFLKKYIIKGALPDQQPSRETSSSSNLDDSELTLCGDFFLPNVLNGYKSKITGNMPMAASIETAVRSGLKAAERIINKM